MYYTCTLRGAVLCRQVRPLASASLPVAQPSWKLSSPSSSHPEIDSLVTTSVLDDVALRDGRDSVGSIERDRPDSKNAGGAGIS